MEPLAAIYARGGALRKLLITAAPESTVMVMEIVVTEGRIMTEITIADFRYNGPDVARGYKTDSPSHSGYP